MAVLSPARRKSIVQLAGWQAFVAALWMYSAQFDVALAHYRFGAVAWPRAILILIAVSAVAAAIVQWNSPEEVVASDQASPEADAPAMRLYAWQFWATLALPVAYVWMLPYMGFFVLTPFLISAYMFTFGQRRPIHLIATSLMLYVCLVVLFSRLLFVALPTGNWLPFYNASNFILSLVQGL